MAVIYPRFITGQGSFKGLAGYLQHMFVGLGTATVLSGATTSVVAVSQIKANDFVYVTLKTKGTNACVVVSTTIVAGTGFTITVDTDPGTGGAVYNYLIIRSPLV
jgi:DNA-binding MurR/RpiR family transcriptional regulator